MRETKPYWLSAGVILWGLIWVWQGLKLKQFDQYAHIGPGLPVTVVGGVLVLLGVILGIEIHNGVRFEEQAGEDVDADGRVSYGALAIAALGCAVPMLTMTTLGFPITAALAFFLIARAFRSPNMAADAAIALIVAFVSWWLFSKLGVQLGPMLPFLKG